MKTTSTITARRIIQGGAAFAALGALSIATALPAAADVEQYGWAYAASEGGAGFVETQDGTASDSFSVNYGWASWSGTTTATVGADGIRSTVEVPSVNIQITVTDVEDDELEKEEPEEEETEDEADPSEEPTDGGSEGDDSEGEGSEGGDDTSGEEGGETGETGETDPTTPPVDENTEAPVEEAPSSSPEAEVLQLDETNSDTVANSDEILVSATITGISVSTFKSWDGSVSYSINEGTVSNVTAPEGVNLTVTPDSYTWEETTDFEGYLWDDAYAVLDYDLKVDGELIDYITVAETGVGTLTLDDGENPGEEKPRPVKPIEKPVEEQKKPAAKPSEALAATGSPIGGLIAAGAAIAAGGGAAAYLARRKKTAVEAPAEENDN
ncbi:MULTISPECIES: cell wall protein [unclassified Nocardiopsis]